MLPITGIGGLDGLYNESNGRDISDLAFIFFEIGQVSQVCAEGTKDEVNQGQRAASFNLKESEPWSPLNF